MIETVCPVAILVLLSTRSDDDVPTVPSINAVPPDVVMRNQVALVPAPAPAVPVPFEIAFNVSTPAEAVPNADALHVSDASKVCDETAVSGLAGCVPL